MTRPVAVIISGARTPTGKFLGGLASLTAPDLGAAAIREAITRGKIDPANIDEVIMGNVVQAGVGQAPARIAAIRAGVPAHVPAYTVNKVCGSGLQSVMLAAQAIRAGDGHVYVAGGMESMSNAPYLVQGMRGGVKFGDQPMTDGLIKDGLWDSFGQVHMGGYAEYTAKKAGITRARQDEFAYHSHMKAVAAIEGGKFEKEIVKIEIAGKKGPTIISTDESPRKDTTLEALAKLRPAFPKDAKDMKPEELTVTAGNAPGLSDGGSALIVTSEEYAKANGLTVLAKITGYASGGMEPKDLFFAPILAVQNLMKLTGAKIGDYDLIEANEAFAAQALADGDGLGWDWARVNVNGGAIALGHPIGSSGARVLVTLLHAMHDRGARTGLATLCLGGGNAVALSVERP